MASFSLACCRANHSHSEPWSTGVNKLKALAMQANLERSSVVIESLVKKPHLRPLGCLSFHQTVDAIAKWKKIDFFVILFSICLFDKKEKDKTYPYICIYLILHLFVHLFWHSCDSIPFLTLIFLQKVILGFWSGVQRFQADTLCIMLKKIKNCIAL